jgi:hypothetical protein
MKFEFTSGILLLLTMIMTHSLEAYTFKLRNASSYPLRIKAAITLVGCKDIDVTLQKGEERPFSYSWLCAGACMGNIEVYDASGNLLITKSATSLPGFPPGCTNVNVGTSGKEILFY